MARRWLVALLLLGALARVWAVDQPIGGVHGWRQADTAAMARNFHVGGYDFLHPQIDWGGMGDGRVESEAPIYAYAVALLYGAFGEWEGWGRLLSIVASLTTALLLFRIGRREADARVGLFAAGLWLLLPMNVYYGRAFMPEPLLLCALAGAVDGFSSWAASGRRASLVAGAALAGLAGAMKLPSLYIGLPLLVLALRREGRGCWRRPALWLAAVLALAPAALWYPHAHAVGEASGLTFHFFGAGDGWSELSRVLTLDFWNRILLQWVAEKHATWPGFALLLAGLALARRVAGLGALVYAWLAALVVYSALLPQKAYVHEYYALPWMLPGVLAMALPCARWLRADVADGRARWARLAVVGLVLGVLASSALATWRYAERVGPTHWPLEGLGDLLRAKTEPDARIVVADHGDPVALYRAHRKGWNAWPERVTADELRRRATEGARYFAAARRDFSASEEAKARLRTLMSIGQSVVDDADYVLVRLRPESSPRP